MSHQGRTTAVIPRLPAAREGDLSVSYVNQLVATLESAIDVLNSTREREFSEIRLTNVQGNGSGLRVGDVFEDAGVLKIVRTGDIFTGTLSATGSVGTVTVSTP